jgi:predicted dehydrogenase
MSYSVLIVGCGHMGSSHARAFCEMDEFDIASNVVLGHLLYVNSRTLHAMGCIS